MPVIIGCILLFILWLFIQKSKADKITRERSNAFWEMERRSNTIRKQDISTLDYIVIPYDSLPFSICNKEEIRIIEDQLLALKEKRIVNLSEYTNTELKLTYGTANLAYLSEYDQNFTKLVRILYRWSELLLKEGFVLEAKTILTYGVSIPTDVSKHYLLLAELYKQENNLDAIKQLIAVVQTISSLTKDTLLDKLNAILVESSHVLE